MTDNRIDPARLDPRTLAAIIGVRLQHQGERDLFMASLRDHWPQRRNRGQEKTKMTGASAPTTTQRMQGALERNGLTAQDIAKKVASITGLSLGDADALVGCLVRGECCPFVVAVAIIDLTRCRSDGA